jgi:cell division protein FtsB
MEPSNRRIWLNFLSLLPGTTLTLLTIAVAFLRFYDERDFRILELIGQPRVWSNRLTVAAALVRWLTFALSGTVEIERQAALQEQRHRQQLIEQQQYNEELRKSNEELRKSNERVEEEQRRAEESARAANERAEERERATRRARVEVERDLALLSFLADPSDDNRRKLTQTIAVLDQYRDSL